MNNFYSILGNTKIKNWLLDFKISILAVAFLLFTVSVVMNRMLSVLFGVKAVCVEESYGVQACWYIYRFFPLILGTSGFLFILGGIASSKPQFILWALTAISGIVSLWVPEILYASVFFFVGYVVLETRLSLCDRGSLPVVVSVPFIGHFLLLFVAGILVYSGLESAITIFKFSGNSFPHASFLRYLGFTISLSVFFALYITIIAIIFIQSLLVILYIAQRYFRMRQDQAVFFLLICHAAVFAYMIFYLLNIAFEDEIKAFGFQYYVPMMAVLPMTFLVVLAWVAICRLSSDHGESSAEKFTLGNFYDRLLYALGLFYIVPIIGNRWKKLHVWLVFFTYLGIGWILVYMNYPVINDYSTSFCLVLSFLLIFCVMALLFTLCRRLCLSFGRLSLGISSIVFLAIAIVCMRFYEYQDVRIITYEYSKISWAKLHLIAPFLPSHKPVGFGKGTSFAYYPEIHGKFTEPKLEFSSPPPIFILVLDALRPDHTNLREYSRQITPNIKKVADEGMIFNNAYTCGTGTTCSLRHIFTGRYSSRFMLEKKHIDPFWVEDLIDANYGTFVINTLHQCDYNGISLEAFKRNIPKEKIEKAQFLEVTTYEEFGKVKEALNVLTQVVENSKKNPQQRPGLFCYLHSCRSHIPWRPTNPIFGMSEVDRYDAAIKEEDEAMGIFMEGIKKLGLYQDAIIIFLADHGTGLMEHGRYGGFLNYQEQIRVPLVIRVPGIAPGVSDEWVQTIDIGPTLVNLVTPARNNRFHGISLAGVVRGKPLGEPKKYLFCLSSFSDMFSVIEDRRYKFQYHRRYGYYMLYDLQQDPRESRNLADSNPEAAKKYLEILDRFLRAGNHTYNNPYHYSAFDPSRFE